MRCISTHKWIWSRLCGRRVMRRHNASQNVAKLITAIGAHPAFIAFEHCNVHIWLSESFQFDGWKRHVFFSRFRAPDYGNLLIQMHRGIRKLHPAFLTIGNKRGVVCPFIRLHLIGRQCQITLAFPIAWIKLFSTRQLPLIWRQSGDDRGDANYVTTYCS